MTPSNGLPVAHAVSIRSRPEGREKVGEGQGQGPPSGFQSAPDPKAGRERSVAEIQRILARFNPLPTRRPGESRPQ